MAEINPLYVGLAIFFSLVIGGTIVTVYDTGEEVKCGTNKPTGFEIREYHVAEKYYDAYCPYADGHEVNVTCSSFRKTPSYERYACSTVIVVEEPVIEESEPIPVKEKVVNSNPKEVCKASGCR